MSKILSYKGKLNMGEQDRIKLRTMNGKTGYKINKFEIISTVPGTANMELIGQIFKTDQTGSITATVDFSNSDFLAVSYAFDASGLVGKQNNTIIIDNEKFNQDIFVNITDAGGGTNPANYYIELETMPLNDIEATMLTLQSIRAVTSS